MAWTVFCTRKVGSRVSQGNVNRGVTDRLQCTQVLHHYPLMFPIPMIQRGLVWVHALFKWLGWCGLSLWSISAIIPLCWAFKPISYIFLLSSTSTSRQLWYRNSGSSCSAYWQHIISILNEMMLWLFYKGKFYCFRWVLRWWAFWVIYYFFLLWFGRCVCQACW